MSAEREIGIDHLTMLDVSPPELVSVAHEAGFDAVSPRVWASIPEEEPWPMTPGSPMLEETASRLEATGVRALSVEVVRIGPGTRREDYEAALEAGARLGARYVTVNSDDPDLDRASETFAALVADALPYGLRPVIEPIPYTRVSNLEQAIYIAERSGGGGILLDALHFWRYGGGSNGSARLTPSCSPTCSSATRRSRRPQGCRGPKGCRAGSLPTAPTCSSRAGRCASCRETASCRWPTFLLRCRTGWPSAWRHRCCTSGRRSLPRNSPCGHERR